MIPPVYGVLYRVICGALGVTKCISLTHRQLNQVQVRHHIPPRACQRKASIKAAQKNCMHQSAALLSAAQRGSVFCPFSCQQHQLNITHCNPSPGKYTFLHCHHFQCQMYAGFAFIHLITVMCFCPLDDLITSHKLPQLYLIQQKQSSATTRPSVPVQLIKLSPSKAISVNGIITDSKLELPAER